MADKSNRPFNWGFVIAITGVAVSVIWFYVQLRVWKEEGHDHILTVFDIVVTILLWALLIITVLIWRKHPRRAVPSRLKIHNADYRAMNGSGTPYDVTECLQKLTCGDCLVLAIQNDSFVVNGQNYVPKDPLFGVMKRLDVTYSFDGVTGRAIRPENSRMVLPEDTFIASAVAGIPQIPFSTFQLEVFQLAKDILAFIQRMGKVPTPKREDYGYGITGPYFPSPDKVHEYQNAVRKAYQPWLLRFQSTWQTDFVARIERTVHEFGKLGIDGRGVLRMTEEAKTNREVFEVAFELVKLSYGIDTMKVAPFLEEEKGPN